MKIEIKSRWDSKVLFTAEVASIALTIEAAIKAGANLYGADLQSADLQSADLQSADLQSANLQSANLYGANLQSANLYGANLYGADLRSANLYGANLYGADLRSANLQSANLQSANLQSAKNISDIANAEFSILPESGAFEGWKKCKGNVLVHVQIPAKARRSNATGRKCRAEYVKVLEVVGAKEGISQHNGITKYIKGKIVRCDKWNEDRWTECGGGIHFFLTRIEAERY